MSGAGEAAEDKTLIEQTGDVPETVTPENAADPAEPPAEEAPAPAAEATEGEPKPPKAQPWFQKRIDELTKARRDAERVATEANARAAVLEAAREAADQPNDGTVKPPSPEDFQKLVRREAEQMLAQERHQTRAQAWLDAGVKEFGGADFNERCALVASLGAEERPDFMQVVTDPDIIPDGHKLVAKLADHPEEAQRILGITDKTKMTAALIRFDAQQAQPPKEVSRAPKPISAIGGSARASAPADNDDIKTWMAKRNAEIAARGKVH